VAEWANRPSPVAAPSPGSAACSPPRPGDGRCSPTTPKAATVPSSRAPSRASSPPELTEGPYYIDGEKLRRDIREGHRGTLLTLRLRVLNASTCKPIKNAVVDIWHCDAAGEYSGFGNSSSNRTFLRGVQKTDAAGLAIFKTIYPGWYRGRTVHVHVKVHVGGRVVHTGQLFFPDSLTDTVYKKAPYAARGTRDMRNGDDSIFVNGGKRGLLSLKKDGAGYVGSISMGVHK
jgi:protocatechuate 3,4-dioxygenase beta subunit